MQVAVERGPLLSSPFVGISILHFTELKRKSNNNMKEVNKSMKKKNREIQKYQITNSKNITIQNLCSSSNCQVFGDFQKLSIISYFIISFSKVVNDQLNY